MPALEPITETFTRWQNNSRYKMAVAVLGFVFWGFAGLNFFVPYSKDRWRLGLFVVAVILGVIWFIIMTLFLRSYFSRRQERQQQMLKQLIITSLQDVLLQNLGVDTQSAAIRTVVEEALSTWTNQATAIGAQMHADLRPIHLDEPAEWALAYEINSRRYGWGYEKVGVTVTINLDGSAEFKREITIRAFRVLSGLEQSLALDPAKLETLTDQSSEPRFFVKGIGCEAKLSEHRLSDGVWVTEVNFEPKLEENSSGSFVLTETMPLDYYAIGRKAQELVDAGDLDQYYAFRIDRPTRELSLTVYLPSGYRAENCKAQVRLIPPARGMTRIRTDPYEEKRIKDGLQVSPPEGRRHKLTLNVNWPVLGRVYVVRWDPLSPEKALGR